MKVHAVQTGTVAVRERQRRGHGRGRLRLVNTLRDPRWTGPLPIYLWVVEHPDGVLVVDTGETARASEPGYFPRWHPYFRLGLREHVDPPDEIGPALRRLGIAPADVRWVVMTHLHTDHAGGLHEFPNSEILVARDELDAARGLRGRLNGYLPHRWPHWFAPREVQFPRDPFGPFRSSVAVTTDGDVRIVPTPGHSVGHASVVLLDRERTLFFAGDVSYTEGLLREQVVDGVAPDARQARDSLERVLHFVTERRAIYLPSHDPQSAQRLAMSQAVVDGVTEAATQAARPG